MSAMKGIPEADTFVRRGLKFVPIASISGHYAPHICCIDGRRTQDREQLGRENCAGREAYVSFPGGGLGIVGLVLSALNIPFIERWSRVKDPRAASARKAFNFDRMIDCLERGMGGMSCHTDDHARGNAMACAGCGHANAFLAGGYGLGKIYRSRLAKYAKLLKKRALAGETGVSVDVYHGKHAESAVLRLKCNLALGEFLSIAPNDGEMSVFVFSEHMAQDLLAKIAGLVYEEMRDDFKAHGIAKEEFLSAVQWQYHAHVRSSAFKLAHNLPVYDVEHTGPGSFVVRKSELRY